MASRTYAPEDLRGWRARVQLSQAEVGKMFGASQRVISLWERGKLPRDFPDRFERVLVDYYANHPELLEQAR